MSLSDYLFSLLRTYVAVWIPAGAAWLADKGIDLPVDPATIVILAVTVSAYYTAVRALESRFPWVGVLLGATKAPTYLGARTVRAVRR